MLLTGQNNLLLGILITAGTFCAVPAAAQQPLPIPQHHVSAEELHFAPKQSLTSQIEQTLHKVFGNRLVPAGQNQFTFSVSKNKIVRQCSLRFDSLSNQIHLFGDRILCNQFSNLFSFLDQSLPRGKERQIIPFQHSKPETLGRAFDLCRRQVSTPPATFRPVPSEPNIVNPLFLEFKPTDVSKKNPSLLNPSNRVKLVDYQFQDADIETGNVDSAVLTPGGANAPKFQRPGDPAPVDVVSDFRYQILPDLDVVVIDADGAEVARFTDMIRQIEELSKIAEPQIEVLYLKHLNCVSLNYVIAQIYNDLFRTTQGAVRILPMATPNAMLLVGWGKSLETMKTLVETLDKPVATQNSRLNIFKFKHVSAQQAQTVLNGAFPVPPANSGFLARIQLFADARSNMLIVQAAPNDLQEIERILNELDVSNAAPKLQVKPFKLKHSLAPDLAKTLTDAISAGTGGTPDRKSPALELLVQNEKGRKLIESGIMTDVSVKQDVRNNTIIVSAPENCMTFIEELITMLDSQAPDAELKILPVIYGDANSMVNTIRSLIPSQMDGIPSPQLPGASGEETLIPIRFAVDTRTNCILAVGAPGDLKIVEALVFSLDREDQQSRKQSVYLLKSMKALDVAKVINEYIRSRREIQQASPGVISPYQQIESEVIVVPEPESNTLLVSATPKYYEEIMGLIDAIDKSPPQVVIRVLIGEVTLSDTDEFGAEFGIQDSLLFNRSTFSSITQGTRTITQIVNGVETVISEPVIVNGTATPGWLFNQNPSTSLGNGANADSLTSAGNVGSQLLTNFGTGRVGAETGFGGMVFSANSDAVSVMLRALQETNRLEILSCPQITTMNNKKAMIHVGEQVPRYRGAVVNTNSTSIDVSDEKVGLMLMVQPNISPEGVIVMSVTATKSKVGTEADGIEIGMADGGKTIRSPKISLINAATMVSAANNETVVLGGLIQREEQKINRKVPLLGDVPLLGKLFRYDFKRNKRTELLIILTPRIVRNSDDMEQVKQIEAARMSWCLRNVAKTYSDIGTYNVISDQPYTGDAPVMEPEPVKMEELQPLGTPVLAPMLPTPTLPKR